MIPRRATACCVALFAVWLAGCVSAPDPRVPKIVENFNLAPYASREECVLLDKGDRLDYRFDATQPVQFAIQYREGDVVLVPISRRDTPGDAGIYPAPESREYCLVWEAGADGARLDYRFVAHAPTSD